MPEGEVAEGEEGGEDGAADGGDLVVGEVDRVQLKQLQQQTESIDVRNRLISMREQFRKVICRNG